MNIDIITTEKTIEVRAPYSADFVARCRELRGKWNAFDKTWVFPSALKDEVLEALNEHYGYVADTHQERITLLVTVHENLSADKAPVKFGPYELAGARGRDSGARTSQNVALLSGSINSGGSVKNWESRVSKGAKFKIWDVPISIAERLRKIAIAETFVTYQRVDDVIREAPTGIAFWEIDAKAPDGLPEGCVRRFGAGATYWWSRGTTKQTFTVEEV